MQAQMPQGSHTLTRPITQAPQHTNMSQWSDVEILGLILQQRHSPSASLKMAAALLEELGSLHGVFNASQNVLCAIPGVGPKKYLRCQAIIELTKRTAEQHVQRRLKLDSVAETKAFFTNQLQYYQHECFAVILVNSQHEYLHYKELFHGTINAASVYPRQIVKYVIDHNAANVILAHNHPSGSPEPSQADISITQRIIAASALIDAGVLDHIIVGTGRSVSFAQRGLL